MLPGRLKTALCAALLAVALTLAFEADAAPYYDKLDLGPKIGEAIPHTLGATDQHGQHQDFKALARRRGLIILFSRSLDW